MALGVNQQNLIAASLLLEFNRPVPVTFIEKATNWQFRQKIQYESIKGLLKDDFLSIHDYQQHMDVLMGAGSIGQKLAWKILKPTVKLQVKLLSKLVPLPNMGWVGRFLLSAVGFTFLFLHPLEILKDKNGFLKRAQ